jgi:hypothetical protein
MIRRYAAALLIALLAGAGTAVAEIYSWKDADGRTHYSDIKPEKDNVRLIKKSGVSVIEGESGESASDKTAPDDAKPKSLAEQEKEFQKRRQAAKEAQEKAQKEREAAARKQEDCERMRVQLAGLKSGQRVATFNAKGEREVMDEDTRGTEIERMQGVLDDSCK